MYWKSNITNFNTKKNIMWLKINIVTDNGLLLLSRGIV